MAEPLQKPLLERAQILRRQHGVTFAAKLISDYWLPGMIASQLYINPSQIKTRLANRLSRRTASLKDLRQAINDIWPGVQMSYDDSDFLRWEDWQVSADTRAAIDGAIRDLDGPLTIAEIDTDGRVDCPYGILPHFEQADSASIPRQRTGVSIIYLDGFVLIRKQFYGDQHALLREWHNLLLLHGKANVPSIYEANQKEGILYKNLIVGRTLRDRLAAAGAKILNTQTERDPELAHRTQAQRIGFILERGAALLPKVIGQLTIDRLAEQMDRIHTSGVAHLSLTFGNIMVDEFKQPWFVDFENSYAFDNTRTWKFHWQRDQDRQKFNRIYNAQLMNEATARNELSSLAKDYGSYAPVNLGRGMAMRGFWSIDSGSGRWAYLNESIMAPLVSEKRVLDLGSNNGVMPLHMLQAGAESVDGIEISASSIEAAQKMQRLFEWADMRRYCLTLHQGNMTDILDGSWGSFDVVTALCTLYYLTKEEMADVTRQVAEMAPLFIVQANAQTREFAADGKAEKSSLSYLHHLLLNNGFSEVELFAPAGFSRPILVARTQGPGK